MKYFVSFLHEQKTHVVSMPLEVNYYLDSGHLLFDNFVEDNSASRHSMMQKHELLPLTM